MELNGDALHTKQVHFYQSLLFGIWPIHMLPIHTSKAGSVCVAGSCKTQFYMRLISREDVGQPFWSVLNIYLMPLYSDLYI